MNTIPVYEKCFTPSEANLMLPLIKRIVDDIMDAGRKMRAIGRCRSPDASLVANYKRLSDRLREYIAELADLGCTYKDWGFGVGHVTFPGKISGQPVLLCWKSDDPEVAYYHLYEENYAGRRRIPAELFPA